MDKNEKRLDLNSELGMSRRDLLRRSAIVGGTLLWVAPAIQSLTPKAFAQAVSGGAVGCAACYCFNTKGSHGNLFHDREQDGPIAAGGLLNAADCDAWCLSLSEGYTGSRYCSGTSDCVGVAKDQNDGTLPASLPSCTGTTTRLAGPNSNYGVICCTEP